MLFSAAKNDSSSEKLLACAPRQTDTLRIYCPVPVNLNGEGCIRHRCYLLFPGSVICCMTLSGMEQTCKSSYDCAARPCICDQGCDLNRQPLFVFAESIKRYNLIRYSAGIRLFGRFGRRSVESSRRIIEFLNCGKGDNQLLKSDVEIILFHMQISELVLQDNGYLFEVAFLELGRDLRTASICQKRDEK